MPRSGAAADDAPGRCDRRERASGRLRVTVGCSVPRRAGARLARRRPGAGPRPRPGRAADAGEPAAFGWSFDPAVVLPLVVVAVGWVVGRAAGRRGASRRTRCRASGRSRSSAGSPRSRSPSSPGIERYDTALFSVHMVQHILLTLVAAPLHRPRGAGHARCSACVAARSAGAGSCRSSTRGRCGSRPPGRRLADLRRRSCGGPTSRRSSTSRSRTGWSTTWSTSCSSARRCCSGGRPSGSTRHRGGCPIPAAAPVRVPADAPEHVPRGDHPQRVGACSTRTTRRSSGRGARRPSSTSRSPAGSCGSPGDLLFIAAIAAILVGWMRHEERDTARSERQARRRAGRDPDARGAPGRAAGRAQERDRGEPERLARPSERERRREVLEVALRVDVAARRRPRRPADRRARRGPISAARNARAATDRAPDGSTTRRLSSAARRTPAAISASDTVTIESSRRERWANVRRPSARVRVPSAIVRETSAADHVTIRPAASDSRASAASSGSTPMTRASGIERPDRDRDAARQPAAADRDEDGGDVRQRPRRSRGRPCPGRR